MQKLSVLRYCCSDTQRFFSTSSLCMMAICPAGPPKLMNPSFTQNQNASQKPTGLVPAASALACDPLGSFVCIRAFSIPLVNKYSAQSNHGYSRSQARSDLDVHEPPRPPNR